MKKIGNIVQTGCFLLFIALFPILLLVCPDREFSPQENRYLKQLPAFSFSRLFSGDFTADFEQWLTDQFPLRDAWIGLKSRYERFTGKTENNNVFFAGGDTLISRFSPPDMSVVDGNIAAVRSLADTGAQVYLSLIPTACDIWSERLPANADCADQRELIDYIYSACGVATVDMYSALAEHADEYIFYRTDHHWTTLGAYYGYTALCSAMGLEPVSASAYGPQTVSDSFYGTLYSSSGVRWVAPDSIEIWVPAHGVTVENYSGGDGAPGMVYDYSRLDTKDKYSMFFGGNTPRMVIDTGRGQGSILVLRDSYSDCMLPFLFDHYACIHVLDLRYYRLSIHGYIAENSIDTVLVNYGISNFSSDLSVSLAGF